LGLNEVILKIWYAGLFHYDLSVIDGSRLRRLPLALELEIISKLLLL
jgi:Zn-dependent alcohol dehydrogenase